MAVDPRVENQQLMQQINQLNAEKAKLAEGLKGKLSELITEKNQRAQRVQELDGINAGLEQQLATKPAGTGPSVSRYPHIMPGATVDQIKHRIGQLEAEQQLIHQKVKSKLQALVQEKYDLSMKERVLLQNQVDPAELQRMRLLIQQGVNENAVLAQTNHEQNAALQNAQMWAKQNNQLRQTLAKLQTDHNAAMRKKQDIVDAMSARDREKDEQGRRHQTLTTSRADLERSLAEEKASQANAQQWTAQNERLRIHLRGLKNEVNVLAAKVEDTTATGKAKVANAGAEQSELETQLKNNKDTVEELKLQISAVNQESKRLQEQAAEVEVELGNLIAEKQACVMQVRQFERKAATSAAQSDKIRKKMLDVEEEHNKLTLRVEERGAALKKVAEIDAANDELRFGFQEMVDRNDTLTNRITQLKGGGRVRASDADENVDDIMRVEGEEAAGGAGGAAAGDGGAGDTLNRKRRPTVVPASDKNSKIDALTKFKVSTVEDIKKGRPETVAVLDASVDVPAAAPADGEAEEDITFNNPDADADNTKPQIRSASLEKLVERLTYEKFPDMEFVQQFMLTYRSFTTPLVVLELVIQRYCITAPTNLSTEEQNEFKAKKQVPIRLRVFNVLKGWINDYFYDFRTDEQLVATVDDFITNIMPATGMARPAQTLKKQLQKNLQDAKELAIQQAAPPKAIPAKNKVKNFEKCDERALAMAITKNEQDLYRKVLPKECFGLAWSKKNKERESPNILAFVHVFNKMSTWVQWEIMNGAAPGKHADRAKIIKKFVKIAEILVELNNFNGCMEILAGLGASSTYRLRKTWEKVGNDKATMSKFEELRDNLSAHQNYKKLRNALHMANPPCIPYFGMYLTDLTFIEDGNKDMLDGLINFNKRRLYATVLREIQQYQQMAYQFQADDAYTQWLNESMEEAMAAIPDETAAYDLSLRVEPRDAK